MDRTPALKDTLVTIKYHWFSVFTIHQNVLRVLKEMVSTPRAPGSIALGWSWSVLFYVCPQGNLMNSEG